jgi:putative ABC transport system permease protein
MLKSYFTSSYRSLRKHKTFTIVNILGMSIAMAGALLIYEYTSYEKSFDDIHENTDNIYRVTTQWNKTVTPQDKRATTVPWSGPGAKAAFSEVIDYTRFAPFSTFTGETWLSYQKKKFAEDKIFFADPGFLKMFAFPLMAGDTTALSDPFSIVLTKSSAKRYFRNENPVGKIISIYTHGNFPQSEFTVTAVLQDPPTNSHLQFDFLVSYSSIWPSLSSGSTYWHWDYTYCYLLLNDQTDANSLAQKMSQERVKSFDEGTAYTDPIDFKLQPLKDIHLFSSLKGELAINGDGRSVYFLMIVGVCILLCAYVNYITLATVKAVERAREMGIRKISGATKWNLTLQLIVESSLVNVTSALVASVIFVLTQPLLQSLTGVKSFEVSSAILTADFFLVAGVIVCAGVCLSSIYPVVMLSNFKPSEVIKGGKVGLTKPGSIDLRKSLIIMQFSFCFAFSVGTFALYRQLLYMKNADVGMDISQVLVVKGFGAQPYSDYENFKSKLETLPSITSVGVSSSAPGEEITYLSLRARVSTDKSKSSLDKEVKIMTVDAGFFKTLSVSFLAGRNFDPGAIADKHAVILNEAAAQLLGYEDARDAANEPLTWGRSVFDTNQKSKIVGVIQNYNQLSLRNSHEPIAFIPNVAYEWQWNKRYYFIRIDRANTNLQATIKDIEQSWKSVIKDDPFNFFFLDQYFDRQYKSDVTFNALFIFFSLLAILIACLGLFGLVAYTTQQRTKEIGVRKVLGASVQSILSLLSKDFVRLMIIATVITVPTMIWGLQEWLSRYAFRIDLTFWLFAIPIMLIFMIALLTVVIKSTTVAIKNPVDSLRYE